MGKVNNYIKKLLNKLNIKENKENPWLKYYYKLPEHLNYYQGSLYDILNDTATKYQNSIAYNFYDSEVTYKKFMQQIDKIAYSVTQFNIVENECITICMPNSPESIGLIYAINKIGAIANIIHPLSTTQDIKRALDETNSSVLFCADVSMKKASELKVKNFVMVPTSTSLVGLKKAYYNFTQMRNIELKENQITWDEFLSKGTNINNYVKRIESDPAAIIYSGGTTGKPKGIIMSNQNFNSMAEQTMSVCKYIKHGYSILSALPIFHFFGLSLCVHTCLVAGMKLIILPKLDTVKLNKTLKKYKPSVFPAVPSLLKMVLKGSNPGVFGFSAIKVVVVGGDYLPADLRHETEEDLRNHGSKAVVKAGYGLSEVTGFCCCTSAIDIEQDSLGMPNPDNMMKIFEPNSDIEKPIGEIGEICISGPTVMMGYINEDEETKKTLVQHTDGKIWLHTGDLGTMNENGIFHYSSRLKRMIISNGYNIYPIELEEIIKKCKYVETCTVVGIPNLIKGQSPKAVIVLKKGIEATSKIKEEIKKYCSDNIAKYAMPKEYEYRETIPHTAVGKVAYRELEKKAD